MHLLQLSQAHPKQAHQLPPAQRPIFLVVVQAVLHHLFQAQREQQAVLSLLQLQVDLLVQRALARAPLLQLLNWKEMMGTRMLPQVML